MYHSKLESEQTDALCEALVSVATKEEAYRVLDDLCTIAEVQAMAQRLAVARLLSTGATYQDIAKQIGKYFGADSVHKQQKHAQHNVDHGQQERKNHAEILGEFCSFHTVTVLFVLVTYSIPHFATDCKMFFYFCGGRV